jgi:hypothetical protein
MYHKKKTLTIPVEYNEVLVPFSSVPDDTDIRFIVNGSVVQPKETEEGFFLVYSQKAEETVIIEYDYREKEDTVSPIVQAIGENATEFPSLDALIEAVQQVQSSIENKNIEGYNDERIVALLQSIQKTLTTQKEVPHKETIDYTPYLEHIAEILATPQHTQSDTPQNETLLPLLEDIKTLLATKVATKDITLPVNNGRIKVEVDRAGVGGLTSEEAKDLRELNEKQDALISAVGQIGGGVTYNLKKFAYNIDADLAYQGKNVSDTALDSDTDWEITKYIYADGTNTESITKTGSWTGRVALFT